MEERRRNYPQIIERLARIEERQVAIDNRINGSIDDIRSHISAGARWRSAIIAIVCAIVLQVVGFSYMYGNLCKTVSVNERILTRILTYSIDNATIITEE